MEKNTEKQLMAANERMLRLRQAREQLTEEVKKLMEHSEQEELRWTAPVIDLMEALYYAFQQQTITDEDGMPVSFLDIVRRCCEVLHTKVPSNPYETANRGRSRKGIKSINYLKRYMLLMERGMENVLWKGISKTLA